MDPSFGESLNGFLEFLVSERRASRHTVAAYRRDMGQLAVFVAEQRGEAFAVRQVDVFLLRQWLGALARVVAPPSVARKVAALKTFFRYLHGHGIIAENPAALLASPKVRKPLPTFLGVDAAREVMETPTGDSQSARGLRDKAMLEVLYGSGLRVGELVALDLGNLDLEGRTVRVIGKGNKERIVPLGRPSVDALRTYLALRASLSDRRGTSHPTALFLTSRGGRMGARQVQLMVHRQGALGAGRSDLHPHALRHTCATHMLEGGADSAGHSRNVGAREHGDHPAVHPRVARSIDEGVR